MRQYAFDRVQVSWAKLDLTEGISAGTSIVEARNAPTWTYKPTGYGRIVRVRNPDKSGSITITIDQTSLTLQRLRFIMLTDENLQASVFPMIITDTTSKEVWTYTNCFLTSEPDQSRGTEAGAFPWVWSYEKDVKTPVLPLTANAVGA